MIFQRACRRREQKKAESAQAEADAAVEQAKKMVGDAERQLQRALVEKQEASKIDSAIRAEIQRNRWTDTLFGVIQTGRQ